jgi:hypothetical protein
MKKVMVILVALFSSLLGGYLSPFPGITLFFLLTVLLFLGVGPDIRLGKDEVLSLLFACYGAASALYAGDKWGAILFSGSLVAGSFFYVSLRNSSDWEPPLLKTIVIGGCIVGLCEALVGSYVEPLGLVGFKDVAPYLLLLIVLFIRPYGLFGTVRIERV